jgi:hypothetical protein
MERIEKLREWKREEKEYLDVKRAHPAQDDFKVFSRVMALKGMREAKVTDLDRAQVFSMGPEGLTLKGVEKAPVIKVPVATHSSEILPPSYQEFKNVGLASLKKYVESVCDKYSVPHAKVEILPIYTKGGYNAPAKTIMIGDEYYRDITKETYPDLLETIQHELGHHIYRMRTGIMRAYTTEEEEKEAWKIAREIMSKVATHSSEAHSSEIPPIVRRKWEEWQKAAKLGLEHEPFLPLPALAKWYEKWKETAIASGISPDDFDDAFLVLDLGLETPEMEDQLRSYLPTLEKPLSEQEREYREALKEQALDAAKVVREALEAGLISPREAGLYRRRPRDIQELSKLRDEVEMLRQQLEMVKREEIPRPPAVVKIKFRYPWSMLKIDKELLGPFKKGDVLEAPREKVESLVARGYAEYFGGES